MLQNVFQLKADLKKKSTFVATPEIVQNDNVRFEIEVTDNGKPLALDNVQTVSLAHSTKGETVVTSGEIEGNKVIFNLGTLETKYVGQVNATVQLYDAEGRISTIKFPYYVVADPTGKDYVPSEKEQTLIEVVMAEAQAKIDELSQVDVVDLKAKQDEFAVQLAQIVSNDLGELFDLLKESKVSKIKLLGDSITAGVGSSGYGIPSDGRVIFTLGATTYREPNFNSPSWANAFRNYIHDNHPSIDFFNAGIGGKSAKWAWENRELWVNHNEDVIFVMLGTNDRSDTESVEEYKMYITQLLDYIDQRSNLMIVMSPNPAMSDFTDDTYSEYRYNFGIKEVDNVLTKLCREKNYSFISHYREILSYASASYVPFFDLIERTGSHPEDLGHKIMWQTIQQKMGFIDTTKNWITHQYMKDIHSNTVLAAGNDLEIYPIGYSYSTFTRSKAEDLGIPANYGGLLVTFRHPERNYSWQTFYETRTSKIYRRNASSSSWYAWEITKEVHEVSVGTGNEEASAFSFGISYTIMSQSKATDGNFPEHQGGLLITHKPTATRNDGYIKQQYLIYGSDREYQRTWQGSSWGEWYKIGGNFTLSTTERNNLNVVGINPGDQVFDTTLNKPLWRNASNDGWVDANGTTV